MRVTAFTLLITAFGLLTTTASAKSQIDIARRGFYFDIEAGYSNVDYKTHFYPGFVADSVDKAGYANRIELGYDFWRNLGVVMSIIYFHKPQFYNVNKSNNSKTHNNLVFAALKAMLPIHQRFLTSILDKCA